MENRSHAIIAVCFLLVFSLAAILVFYWLADRQSEPLAYEIVTSESVDGLAKQSEVKFKGLIVGHVIQLEFDPDDRSRVIVHLRLQPNAYVTHATYAVVAIKSLTGGKVLQLELGQGSRAHLETSDEHPARIPLRKSLLAGLEDSAQQDMNDLREVLGSASKILDDTNREHITASLRQIDELTEKLTLIETQLTPTITQLPALTQEVQRSLEQSRALLTNANKLIREAKAPVRNATQLEASIQALTRSSRDLSRRLDTQTVPDVDALSTSLVRTSQQLDQVLRELKAKPQSLIFGPPQHPPGPGEPGFDGVRQTDSTP